MYINNNSKQSQVNKNFYSVPSHEEYSLSPDGAIMLNETGEIIPMIEGVNGYNLIRLGLSLGRCMAEVFSPIPEGKRIEELIAFHKNGCIIDDRAENLEWVESDSDVLKFSPERMPLLCKDYLTGEITDHYTLNECARYIERNPSILHDYLKSPNKHKRLISNRYSIIRPGEKWPVITNLTLFNESGWQVDWILYDTEERTLYIYGSLAGVARRLKAKYETLKSMVGRETNKNIFVYTYDKNRYLFSRKRDFKSNLLPILKNNDIPTIDLRLNQEKERMINRHKVVRPPVPIRVTNLITNKVTEYPSSQAFCDIVLDGVKKNTFQCHIKRHNGVYNNHWKVEYIE